MKVDEEKEPTTYTTIEARKQFSEMVNQAAYAGQPTVITRSGKKMAVVISFVEYEQYLLNKKKDVGEEVKQDSPLNG